MEFFKGLSISSGYDLLCALKPQYDMGDRHSWWWPRLRSEKICGGVEVCGGLDSDKPSLELCFASFLGQNTKYENAFQALVGLYGYCYRSLRNILDSQMPALDLDQCKRFAHPREAFVSQSCFDDMLLEFLASCTPSELALYIRPAGFYNQKARYIVRFAQNLLEEFGSFGSFAQNVSKEWLLAQSGVGNESACSILNYALRREEMVVDSYTQKLLGVLGFEFYSYEDLQSFVACDLYRGSCLYDFEISLAQIMARMHGKIVVAYKEYKRSL